MAKRAMFLLFFVITNSSLLQQQQSSWLWKIRLKTQQDGGISDSDRIGRRAAQDVNPSHGEITAEPLSAVHK